MRAVIDSSTAVHDKYEILFYNRLAPDMVLKRHDLTGGKLCRNLLALSEDPQTGLDSLRSYVDEMKANK